jgi:2,3-bisphosphoglycerate-independent phosphoglycerate mutase
MQTTKYPLALIILDGFGIKEEKNGNAIAQANKPNFDYFCNYFPKTTLAHSGLAVGLPQGIVGNSEVGHKSIGSGRISLQTMFAIKNSLLYGNFFNNEAFLSSINHAREKNSSIHIIGLLSDAGGHSHIDHLFGIFRILIEHAFTENVFVHIFTDGRDVPPKSAEMYIKQVYEVLQDSGLKAHIASIGGRYFGMDRAENWDRIEKAYDSMIGVSENKVKESSIYDYIKKSYEKGITDEFIEPATILNDNDEPVGPIKEDDSLIFFNFRPDRMKELLKCFFDNDFDHFNRKKINNCQTTYIKDLHISSLTEYETDTKDKTVSVAFREEKLDSTLAEVLSKNGLTQAHIAETEKVAHITYFLNGGHETPFPGEEDIFVPSPKVKTYDLDPEMSNVKIADTLIENLQKKNFDFYAVNFASSDMVGHTGVLKAGISTIESIDKELGRIYQEIEKQQGFMIITSDHGNIEEMINPSTGEIDTEHNVFPSPFIIASPHLKRETISPTKLEHMAKNPAGTLADVMPTILELYGITMPEIINYPENKGSSLLERLK